MSLSIGQRVRVVDSKASWFNMVGPIVSITPDGLYRILLGELPSVRATETFRESALLPLAPDEQFPKPDQLVYSLSSYGEDLPVLERFEFVEWMVNPGATAATWVLKELDGFRRIISGTSANCYHTSIRQAWEEYVIEMRQLIDTTVDKLDTIASNLKKLHRQRDFAIDRLFEANTDQLRDEFRQQEVIR